MDSGIRTRQAGYADVFAIARFQTATWNEAYRGVVPASYLERTTVADRELRWADRIGRRDILLAERLDEQGALLVAVASSSLREDDRPGPRLELNTLYVAEEMRGAGLGARLVRELLRGMPAVVWVFAANPRAIAFYRACGFHLDGQRTTDDDTGLPEVRLTRG